MLLDTVNGELLSYYFVVFSYQSLLGGDQPVAHWATDLVSIDAEERSCGYVQNK
jgi:hypothetical protein